MTPPLEGSATVYHTHGLDKQQWLGLQSSGGAVPPTVARMGGRKGGQGLAFQEHSSRTTSASSTFSQVIGRVVYQACIKLELLLSSFSLDSFSVNTRGHMNQTHLFPSQVDMNVCLKKGNAERTQA